MGGGAETASAGVPARSGRRGWVLAVCALVIAVTVSAVTAVAVDRGGKPAANRGSTGVLPSARVEKLQAPLIKFVPLRARQPLPAGVSLVARLHRSEPGYDRPGGPIVRTVPGSWYGIPSMLLVIRKAPNGWLRVRLAQRPDGSTSWIRDRDVTLSTTPYAIDVNLTTTRIDVYRYDKLIYDFPAGVGAPDDPTPTGHYFVVFDALPPSVSLYGPFIIFTSAHSNAIQDWDGSGDAVIGIHGPIGSYADSEIGTTGAHISHGCIRLHISDLEKLQVIPPGTPVDIVA